MSRILVTGGAGFIGSNFIRQRLARVPTDEILNLDLVTYAGNLENLVDLENDTRYRFVRADIADEEAIEKAIDGRIDAVVHFAAESHVDRSIEDPSAFLKTNVLGTQSLVNWARRHDVKKFVHVSTDEVYGTLGDDGAFTEETPLAPNSPYSASKASSDFLVRAAVHTHGFPAVITRCSNNYGPYQFPEKLIPLMISNAIENKPLPVYGTGKNVRDWIWVLDHCTGIELALDRGRVGAVYNFGGKSERKNIDVVRAILSIVGKDESLIRYVTDRKGHDLRYAIDCSLAERELGFRPTVVFEEGLRKTVEWYRSNEAWWRRIKSGEYRQYYERMYGQR